ELLGPRAGPHLLGRVLTFGGVPHRQHDICPRARQLPSDGQPEATVGSGDDGDLAALIRDVGAGPPAGHQDILRATEAEYAGLRKRRTGSSDSSIPSVTRVGSNTKTSPPVSRPVSRPVTSSVPTSTRQRLLGHPALGSLTGSPGIATWSSSVKR